MAGLREKPAAEFLEMKSDKITFLCDVILCHMLVYTTYAM